MTSLIITCQGRTYHLQRLLEGVERNSMQPDEIIIVSNDAKRADLPSDLNIKIIPFPYEDFPIGKNRNLGASKAKNDLLFFLDVDCIPEAEYFRRLYDDYKKLGGLCMGNPYYLQHKVPEGFNYQSIHEDAIPHPHRPKLTESRPEEDYAIFWSLCFAISKVGFEKIGGFDPDFIGYGAEDTDFAFMAREKGIQFNLCTAIAYHQQHPIYRPPVNHLEDIVYNSNLFYKKWGKWPMGSWLKTFEENNWIKWHETSSKNIEIQDSPSKATIENFRVENARFV